MNRFSIGAGIALLVFALPATAAPETYRFKGESANATFWKGDDCNSTQVEVQVYGNISPDIPRAPKEQLQLWFYYASYNMCTASDFRMLYGGTSKLNFRASSSLHSASLTAQVPVYDPSTDSQKTIDITLQWVGVGEIYRGHSVTREHYPNYLSIVRSNSASRKADVSGNIYLGVESLIEGLPFGDANLYSTNSGTIEKN